MSGNEGEGDLSPAEFTRRLAKKLEDEAGAGPGAPETVEPGQGLPPDGGRGPGGPAFREPGRDRPRE